MLMDMTVKEFIEELASNSPAPGGGSVAALSGSLAAALVSMVAQLTINMAGVPEQERERMRQALGQASGLMQSLGEHVDEDTAAFNRVMEAYRMPKDAPDGWEQRSRSIQQALQGAAEHPLQVAEECLRLLYCCREAVRYGNPNALSDAGVAALMAHSGVMGALFNVVINLGSIKDPAFRERLQADKDRIMGAADGLRKEIMEALEALMF
ncbi:MAG: cyclodeaminase/cyclohydrolase family protein [Thermacetogeniaceae bacterium]|jgi:formiminotetrahydrofolate cyclodeaminase